MTEIKGGSDLGSTVEMNAAERAAIGCLTGAKHFARNAVLVYGTGTLTERPMPRDVASNDGRTLDKILSQY